MQSRIVHRNRARSFFSILQGLIVPVDNAGIAEVGYPSSNKRDRTVYLTVPGKHTT